MTQEKSYIVNFVSTAIFAVLSFMLMITFKLNEDYFDANGRLGTLATNEEQNIIMETTKAISYKRNISVVIDDRQEKRLVLPIKGTITKDDIAIREEFASGKVILTLRDCADLVDNNTVVVTDSRIMDAVGLYRQEDDVVLEIYEKEPLGMTLDCNEKELVINFSDVNELYNYVAVVYIPFEEKERLYSEEWVSSLTNLLGEDKKIYLASAMREKYTSDEILEFVNRISADMLIEINYENTNEPEHIDIVYNGDYFIPDFSSADLAVLERKYLEEKSGLYVANYVQATEQDSLIKNAELPAAKANIYIQQDNESIEDKYTLNHNVMEAITSIIKGRVSSGE